MNRPQRTFRAPLTLAGAAMLVLALGSIYAGTLSVNHEYDSLDYALRIEAGKPFYELFHPHHLAHGFLARVVYQAAQAMGYQGRAMLLGQLMSSVLGAAGILAFFFALRRSSGDALAAALGGLGMAFCFGWWHASTILAVRVLNGGALVLCYWALGRALGGRLADLLLLGLAHGFAALCHQTNALLTPAILLVLLIELPGRASEAPGRRWLQVGAYLAAYLAVAAGIYLLVGQHVWMKKTPATFGNWLFAYMGVETWNRPLADPVRQAIFGWNSLFFGSVTPSSRPLGLLLDDARSLLAGMVSAAAAFLALAGWWRARRQAFLPLFLLAWGLAMLLCPGASWLAPAGLAGLAYAAYRGWRRPARDPWGAPQAAEPEAWPLLFAGLWLAAYVPFFLWWEPWNVEYWLSCLPALIILLVHALAFAAAGLRRLGWAAPLRWALYGAAALAVALLFDGNLRGKVAFDARPGGNRYYSMLQETARLRPRDTLLILGDNAVPLYLRHERVPCNVLPVFAALKAHADDPGQAFTEIERGIRVELKRARVYMLREVTSGIPEDHVFLERTFELESGAVRSWARSLEVKPAMIDGRRAEYLVRVTGIRPAAAP